MSHYKPYPAYKDSGIEWIGEVPEHWKVVSLLHLFNIKAGGDLKKDFYSEEKTEEYSYPIYTNSIKSNEAYGFTSKPFFKANTITVTGRGEIGYAIYRDHEYDAIIRLLVLTPKNNKPCKYFAYCINSILVFFGGNTAVSQLSTEQISPYKIFCPPFPEQQSIVSFLDRQTAHIDALITKKTRFIELLKEKRQALITHAVTKGLDPNVKMKDSGVEWIGEVPEKWEAVKISHIGKLTKANGGSKQDNVDSGISCIRYGDLYTTHEYIIRKSRSYIEEGKLDEYTAIQYGDALFAASGETFEDIGRSAVNLLKEDACCGGDVIVLKPSKDIDPLFLGYALDSIPSKYQKALMGRGYTVVHIYTEQLRDLIVAVPPSFEQKTIGIALDRQTARIDLIIEKTQRSIDLLRERRSALITAAVTGQIDLRETI